MDAVTPASAGTPVETTARPAAQAHYLGWAHVGRRSPLLYLLAIILGFVGWQAGSIPALLLMSSDPATQRAQFQLSFILPALLLLLLVRLLLGRPGWTVALPMWPPRWRDWFVAVAIGWSVMLLLILVTMAVLPGFTLTYRGWGGLLSGGLTLLVTLCAGFIIQSAFEELYFRGLMMQATRRLTQWIPVVIGVQAYVFASMHAGNLTGIGDSVFNVMPHFVAGLYFGWVAWRTRSLIIPMGLHFANNAWSALFINTKGDVIVTAAPFVGSQVSLTVFIAYALGQATLVVCAVEWWMRWREGSNQSR